MAADQLMLLSLCHNSRNSYFSYRGLDLLLLFTADDCSPACLFDDDNDRGAAAGWVLLHC